MCLWCVAGLRFLCHPRGPSRCGATAPPRRRADAAPILLRELHSGGSTYSHSADSIFRVARHSLMLVVIIIATFHPPDCWLGIISQQPQRIGSFGQLSSRTHYAIESDCELAALGYEQMMELRRDRPEINDAVVSHLGISQWAKKGSLQPPEWFLWARPCSLINPFLFWGPGFES